MVFLTRLNNAGREIRMVRRIREILCFQAERMMRKHSRAILTFETLREAVCSEQLDARQIGENLHHAAAFRIIGFRDFLHAVPFAGNHKVVVKALDGIHQAGGSIDILTDRLALGKIERGSGDRGELSGGDKRDIGDSITIRVDLKHSIADIAAVVAAEVKERMVREIHDGFLIADGLVIDFQRVVLGKRVGDLHLERAGETALAVGSSEGEAHGGAVAVGDGIDGPDLHGIAVRTAMQLIDALAGDQLNDFAVKRELGVGNTVAVAAHQRALEVVVSGIFLSGIVSYCVEGFIYFMSNNIIR